MLLRVLQLLFGKLIAARNIFNDPATQPDVEQSRPLTASHGGRLKCHIVVGYPRAAAESVMTVEQVAMKFGAPCEQLRVSKPNTNRGGPGGCPQVRPVTFSQNSENVTTVSQAIQDSPRLGRQKVPNRLH